MLGLDVTLISSLSDNYIYILRDRATGQVGVVDPGESGQVRHVLDIDFGGRLDRIFITHHHADHTDGVSDLVAAYGADVVASAAERDKFCGATHFLNAGDRVALGESEAHVISTPGHTNGHISYAFEGHVFCGDALFACGCGRMFEGNSTSFWSGLKALRGLDESTYIWCGHEYTLANVAFALSVDPDNSDLREFATQVRRLRDLGKPTLPQTIGDERKRNPFLRADDQNFAHILGMQGKSSEEVFAHLRKGKDNF